MRRILFLMLLLSLYGQSETLKVGIKPSEPWVMYDQNLSQEQRNPIGFSIDLWNAIGKDLNVKTEWVYYDSTSELIEGAKKGQVDTAISAITITSDREREIDFSSSMYELGLQVMVDASKSSASVLELMGKEIKKMMNVETTFMFLLFLVITIHLRWFVDRRDSTSDLFSKNYFSGIIDAFWWGITMLITWETPPSKGLARVIDLLWHIVGILAVSILTAIVTSALTAQAIGGSIRSEKDLAGKFVAAVATDAPRRYVEKIGANVIPVKTIEEGIALVRSGKAEALVHDGPRLVYLANQINKKEKKKVLTVAPFTFNPQNYGIVFQPKNELKEKVDRSLLKLREADGLEKSFHEKLKEKWLKNTQ
ncbi:MAG: Glutamine ABC transporter, periplasmic glutamine-binding protein [uncultured Sulfurovum sp.]|uniref:Glutamine ABC transporter, periplasmic glutamine-binding protein n=1 Tax=uncultured Sulfurovum sp. TaxID=269237 RepID=A0A6S6SX64_9BACT|nr:MAG: Glutamine ABC transporter, periplasmic glutamine-binding protein [uncultured Sulfurovum sp.]